MRTFYALSQMEGPAHWDRGKTFFAPGSKMKVYFSWFLFSLVSLKFQNGPEIHKHRYFTF